MLTKPVSKIIPKDMDLGWRNLEEIQREVSFTHSVSTCDLMTPQIDCVVFPVSMVVGNIFWSHLQNILVTTMHRSTEAAKLCEFFRGRFLH